MKIIDDERRINEVRAARQSETAQARKLAITLFVALRPFASSIHNSGNLFEARATERILNAKPIDCSTFWGVGGKEGLDIYDEKLLNELARVDEVVTSHYNPGAEIHLILADEHGRFNRFTGRKVSRYLTAIEDAAAARRMRPVWLSDLYREWGLSLPNPHDPIDIESEFYINFWANPNYFRARTQLIESASRHSQAGVDPEKVAFHYGFMRRMEASYLVAAFPDSILLVNTSKELGKPLLPEQMPHFYLNAPPAWFLGVN